MNYYDKLYNLIKKNGGFITTREVVEAGIDKSYISSLIKKGEIVRITRGYYGVKGYIPDPYYMISIKSKNAVFSLNTALYLHNLSDRNPLVYNVTVPSGYGGSLQENKNVSLNFVKKEILEVGVIQMTSPFGMPIKVYDVERTICDIIKNKNKIDAEIFSNALRLYAKSKNKNLNKLNKYAKAMNIQTKVSEYMEVLI